jgi:hypothetical protein
MFEPTVVPVPHWYELPDPPVAVSVTELPEQIVVTDAEMLVGAVDGVVTDTEKVTPDVFEHGDDCVRLTQ